MYLFFIQRQASKLPARKNTSQDETINSEQILAQPIKNKSIKVHLCGRVPEDWLTSAQSNGFEINVVDSDFNANLEIFANDLALRIYTNSLLHRHTKLIPKEHKNVHGKTCQQKAAFAFLFFSIRVFPSRFIPLPRV